MEEVNAKDSRAILFDIKCRLVNGIIDYESAKAEAGPAIDAMNNKAAEIARKHGKRFKPFSFASIMR